MWILSANKCELPASIADGQNKNPHPKGCRSLLIG